MGYVNTQAQIIMIDWLMANNEKKLGGFNI